MKKKIRLLASLLTVMAYVILLTNSCKKEEVNNSNLPYVQTRCVTNITTTTAICEGGVVIVKAGTDTIISRGVCWSTNQNPTIADSFISKGTGEGSFIINLTGLTPNTKYFLRAYASNKSGTVYGYEVVFKTYTGTITDIEGNVYYTVTIGTQIWMAENLKTTKYRNGDPIPNAIEDSVWWNPYTKAYCDYNNDTNNGKIYGHLYNWWVVNDSRNIAPTGWHVPSKGEWTILINYLGGDSLAVSKLMECDCAQTHWHSMGLAGGTNESGFTALPGGYRNSLGGFTDLHYVGNWWTSTDNSSDMAWYINLNWVPTEKAKTITKKGGASVRCIKDN
jgi:uncharacterized protein (TIGR02145 family)